MEIFSTEEQDKIVQAISVAEGKTSGEIRLVVERRLKEPSPLDAAVKYFHKLDMHKTALQNGVLIYISVDDHHLAIIGDCQLNKRVEADFWDSAKEAMLGGFRKDDLVEGLISGIQHIGDALQYYFPRKADDVNELPDDIYFGEN